jgi:hypothetical protein
MDLETGNLAVENQWRMTDPVRNRCPLQTTIRCLRVERLKQGSDAERETQSICMGDLEMDRLFARDLAVSANRETEPL